MGDVSVFQQLGKEISDSSLKVQLHGLKEAGDAFREEEARSNEGSQDIARRVMTLFENTDSRDLQTGCLRVIANFVVENDTNRKVVMENRDFLLSAVTSIKEDSSETHKNTFIIMTSNFINEFDPGAQTINDMKEYREAFLKLLSQYTDDNSFNLSILLQLILDLLSLKNSSKEYSIEFFSSLVTFTYLHDSSVDKEEISIVVRILLKLIEQDVRFEEFLVQNRSELIRFIKTFLGLANYYHNDSENSDLSKPCLAAVGNLFTHSGVTDMVKISEQDEIFALVLDLFNGSFECPKEFPVSENQPYFLFKGIACLILGNLATSLENVQMLLNHIPNLVTASMTYFLEEKDIFALQGTHLIKNITVSSQLPIARQVIQNGGAQLIKELCRYSFASNLKVLGMNIAKNLISSMSNLSNLDLVEEYEAIIKIMKDLYIQEDNMEVKQCIVFACDAAVSAISTHQGKYDDEVTKTVLSAAVMLTNVFIQFLHSVYKSGGEVNVIVTLKATKSLGVLSSIPVMTMDQSDSEKNISIVEYTIDHDNEDETKIVDILSKFSSRLVENQPDTKDEDGSEVVSKTFKGIVNNIGYIGAKLQHSANREITKACETAIRNASN